MAKSYGKVGFTKTVETDPGVWEDRTVEKEYSFDVIQNHRRWTGTETLNDNMTLSVKLSIVADDFATQNLPFIRYAVYHGNKFAVTMVEEAYPRYVMSLGGVYNG